MAAIIPMKSSESRRHTTWLIGSLLVVLTLAAYANTFRVPFLFDDVPTILENPSIKQLSSLREVLFPAQAGGLTTSGRPIVSLSLALNYALSGDNVWSYHVFNLLVHITAGLVLFGLIRRTLLLPSLSVLLQSAAAPIAAVVAALWLLHPLQTESVTYIVQRAEALMALFYLLTLYFFIRSIDAPKPRPWLLLSVASCLLGMASKEVMVSAPLIVLLYDRTFIAGSFRSAWRQRRSYYFFLAGTWLVLAELVLSTGGNRGGTVGLNIGIPWWAYWLTQFEAITRYLGLSLWPHPLIFDYGTQWVRSVGAVLPFALVIISLLLATIVALRRRPAIGFAGAWFFCVLAPTSLMPSSVQLIVEHRMYLALVPLLGLLGRGAYALFGRRALWIGAVIAIIFGSLTFARNRTYVSALNLWSDTVAKRPQSLFARDHLAHELAKAGRFDEAVQQHLEAVRLKPDDPKLHYNLGLALDEAGHPAEAVRAYEESLRLQPVQANVHNNLGVAFKKLGDPSSALRHYGEAVTLRPDDSQARYNYALSLFSAGQIAASVGQFELVLKTQPDNADAHNNLGTALIESGQAQAGVAHYQRALQLKPDYLEARINLGNAWLFLNQTASAQEEFTRALHIAPQSAEAHLGAGSALEQAGRLNEAVAAYETALKLEPRLAGADFKLANAYFRLDQLASAIVHYQAALRLAPNDAEAHNNLGVAHAKSGQWAEAEKQFVEAVRLKPDYTEARIYLERVRAMR